MIDKLTVLINVSNLLELLKSNIYHPTIARIFFRFTVQGIFILPSILSAQEVTTKIQPGKQDTIQTSTIISAQISSPSQFIDSMKEYKKLNEELPGEKVYLHLDRPNYTQGDTLWFKAYSWFGYDQIPDTISGILYVDLINPGGRVVAKRKLLIQNGTSIGDFCLDTTIIPGKYTLRAYTRWMQNLNTGEPYYQTVSISPPKENFQVECIPVIIKQAGNDSLKVSFRFLEIDQTGDLKNSLKHEVNYSLKIGDKVLQSGKILAENTKTQTFKYSLASIEKNDTVALFDLSINDNLLNFEKQFRIPLQENIDLQFFPEGGNLVIGLESKVAFKAIGTDGLSIQIGGEIKDDEENVVTTFEVSHKGMGAFLLKPVADKKYFAQFLYNNKKYVVPLPPASEKGCVMSVNYNGTDGSDPYLSIKQKLLNTGGQKYVVGSAYGKIWFFALVKIVRDSSSLRIPLELLPDGVCRITVLNSDFEPESERLFYANKNQRFKIEVEPDSSSYRTRSKVTLLIKTTGLNGEPLQTDLSLAVVDKERITKGIEVNGIRDYKLLQSELRGYIEDLGFYFKNDSCTNYNALDLLLLTQGYRKFLPYNRKSDQIKFQPEKSFDISGKIVFSGSKSQQKRINYSEINLILMCRSEGFYLDESKSDSLGRFRFHVPIFNGKYSSVMQATTSKKKPFYGEIILDDTDVTTNFGASPSADHNILSRKIEYVQQLQTPKKNELSQNPLYGVMNLNIPEITVTASSKNWYLDFEHNAKKIADLDSLDPEGKKYENLYDLLIREFDAREYLIAAGEKTILLPSKGFGPPYHFPIYVINGITYFNGAEKGQDFIGWLNYILSVNVNEIKKIMVLPPGNIPSYYADPELSMYIKQSLVVIETYSKNTFRGDPKGIKTFIFDGLDAPRTFYSPRYETTALKNPIFDSRATLYWEPSIKTDYKGEAKIDFFTTDRNTSLEVNVNGIEVLTGIPGQKQIIINSSLIK